MSLGRQRERQADMLVSWAEMPRSPGHVFYDKLQAVLIAADFDAFVETQCAKDYAPRRGRPSLPPGRYFRMLLIGYFEGIDSERGLESRCADSSGGLQQPNAATLRGSSPGIQASCRTGGAWLCPDPRSRRRAPGLVARPGQRAEALSGADVVVQGFRQKQELGTVMAGDMWHIVILTQHAARRNPLRESFHTVCKKFAAPKRF
jgi:hypothetical protein